RAQETQEDPKFVAGLFDSIHQDVPDVNDTEREVLMGARNEQEYYELLDLIERHRKEQELSDMTRTGVATEFVGDVLPELLLGLKGAGMISKMATGARRTTVAVAGNAALSGGYEVARQK